MTNYVKPKNALVHGVYSSDVTLPWENAEEFRQHLAGLRNDLYPEGTLENDIVFDMACLSWKKRRLNRLTQLALLQNQFAAKLEDTGKRSVEGMRTEIDVQRLEHKRKKTKILTDVSNLAEAMTLLAADVSQKNRPPLGKLGGNIRYILGVLDNLEQSIAAMGSENDGEAFDLGPCFDIVAKALELEARLDGLYTRAFQRLVMAREYRKQYPPKPTPKLIGSSAAQKTVTGRTAKKIVEDNDNNNDDNNNNNVDPYDLSRPENFDWEHEYDEAQKALRKKA